MGCRSDRIAASWRSIGSRVMTRLPGVSRHRDCFGHGVLPVILPEPFLPHHPGAPEQPIDPRTIFPCPEGKQAAEGKIRLALGWVVAFPPAVPQSVKF